MAQQQHKIKLSLTPTLLESLENLPKPIQKKTREFIKKFSENAQASSINYETIENVRNDNLRSVRIDLAYRGIVLKPKSGDIYHLLWVDHHDEAYQWAQSRRVDDDDLESLAYSEVKMRMQPLVTQQVDFLRSTSIVDFIKIGVPVELIDSLRAIENIDELDDYRISMEDRVYIKLRHFINGYNIDQLDGTSSKPDENPFVMVEDISDPNLIEIISDSLNKWRIYLHPKQLKLANGEYTGSAKIIGPAGTGKTVVALHRTKYLYKKLNRDERILFTTFTRTLADDLKIKLNQIQSLDSQIEIMNIDMLVSNLIKFLRLHYKVSFDTYKTWQEALEKTKLGNRFSTEFMKDEWEDIILSNGIGSETDYLNIPRVARIKKLDRNDRVDIWRAVTIYKDLMVSHGLMDGEWIKLKLVEIIKKQYPDGLYKHVIVDEAQDMSTLSFRLIRALAGKDHQNDIFIVGDARQRIYKNRASLKSCGINVVGNSYSLDINYRTTDAIATLAEKVISEEEFDDLDGEKLGETDLQSVVIGNDPQFSSFETIDEECKFIYEKVANLIEQGVHTNEICVVLRTNELMQLYANKIEEYGIKVIKITHDNSDSELLNGVRFLTMHRIKGLEFSHIFLAGLSKEVLPLQSLLRNIESDKEKSIVIKTEKSLLYVAMTRARHSLILTCTGEWSDIISIKESF